MDGSKRGVIRSKGTATTSFAPGPRASRGSLTGQLEDTGLDLNQDARTVVGEILRNLSRKEGLTKGKRLAYLNAFVHFLQKQQSTANTMKTKYYNSGKGDRDYLGFTTKEICLCLRTSLVSQSQVIRIATLRVLRYLVVKEEDVIALNLTGIPILIVRALDIILNNSGERLQAVRLIQEILTVQNGARHFPMEITRALVAIGFDGLLEKDKLHRASLSILCQLALVRSDQLIQSGGVRILLHNIFSCTSPMVLETIIGSLLHLLNISETRKSVCMNLHSLVAPLTDLHFKHSGAHHESYEKEKEEREIGYKSSKLAIGIVLKSWSGLFSFSQDNNSGLQALIDALYIEQLEIRRTILDLLCEIFGITFNQWTDEVVVALQAVDPTYSKDSWRLQEGFIVEEAFAILPHLAGHVPNITANHMALLVYSFVQKNLLDALVEVIVTSDTFISVRATVLLGEILSLVDHYLPVECFDSSRCIPSLLAHCSDFDLTDQKRHRALEAISVLNSLHKIKSRAKMPNSLFLSQQLHFAGTKVKGQGKFIDRLGKIQLNRILRKDIENNPTKLLKESGVLGSKDPLSWSWETILVILRWCPSSLKKVEDSTWRTFLRRLVDFFKLSNNLFARFEFGQEDSTGKLLSSVGVALFQFLSEDSENFSGENLLEEILVDFGLHLDELLRQKNNPFVCFLSPNKLHSTQSQSYFLFIGRMTLSQKGWKILERGEIHKRLLQIVLEVQHETYTKLILSSIFYGNEFSRKILNAALNSQFQGIRLYATKFLRVLSRVKLTDFSKWGIEMLVNQLGDKDKVISLTALDILEESVHDKMYLESLIALRPTLSHLGDRGLLLLITFLSLPSGFKFLLEANFLKKEISKWRSSYNKRYVELVEVLVRDSVSTLRRGEDGLYPERTSKTQEQSYLFQIFVPPHLYGQLAQHKSGFELLIDHADIDNLIEIVKDSYCRNPEETRELKAALWALSHMGASIEAFPMLDERDVLGPMVYLASNCPVLSVRHTVFHCLCLLCTTQVGAQTLERFGWFAMPRSHHEEYPIWSPPMSQLSCTGDLLSKRLFPDLDEEDEDDILEKSSSTTGSNLILEEDDDDGDQYYLADEVADEDAELANEKQLNQSGSSSVGRKGSSSGFPHIRSLSETQIIPSLSQSLPLSTLNENEKVETLSSSLITRSHSVKRNGSWKWRRKSRSDSVTDSTSGVSSSGGDSATGLSAGGRSFPVKTLSPIQSSASIATTTIISNPPSTSSNFSPPSTSKAFTDPGFSRFPSGGSPLNNYMYRSMTRKRVIRWPVSQDTTDLHFNERGRSNSTTNRRLCEDNLKSGGSLDRNLILTPRDLFQESKLMRANSSVTSLSTPSFRLRSESEAKSPCFMGLCLPKSLDMIFLLKETTELETTASNETNYQTDFNIGASTSAGAGSGDFIFEFHTTSNCLGCMYKESLIEGSLLSGDEPKSLENIIIPPTTSAGLDNSSLISIGSIISGGSSLECKNERRKICPDSFEGKNLIRREIIKLLTSMISCVGSKANEQGLLRLRQKFPKSFQDLCLYSEICGIFSRHNVRLNLRRFFQEIFLDLSFENFYDVSDLILDNFNQLNSFEEQNCCESEVSMSSDTTATSTATTVIEVHPAERNCPSPNETEPPDIDDEDDSDDQSSEFLDLR